MVSSVTTEPATHQPSINGPYIDAAESSDLAFRQKLLVIGVFMQHDLSPSHRAPLQAIFGAGRRRVIQNFERHSHASLR